jgi:YD repeat-containing protein
MGAMFPFSVNGQDVSYTYDAAGNRTARVINMTKSATVNNAETAEVQPSTDLLQEQSITIYPNPTKGILSVSVPTIDNNMKGEVSIIGIDGGELMRKPLTSSLMQLNISSQPSGIYLMRISIGTESVTWKIIKE